MLLFDGEGHALSKTVSDKCCLTGWNTCSLLHFFFNSKIDVLTVLFDLII